MDNDAVIFAKASLQRALLGYVLDNVRAIVFSFGKGSLSIRFYIDGEILEANIESSSCVETEVMADYDSTCGVSVECLRVDYPAPIEDQGVWVFNRQESF